MSSTRRDAIRDVLLAIQRTEYAQGFRREVNIREAGKLADAVEAALREREDAEDFAIALDSVFEYGCSDDQWREVLNLLRGDSHE